MTKVALIRVAQYDANLIAFGLESAFRELEVAKLFHTGEHILIKPNLLSAVTPDCTVTPHPAVFDALAGQLARYNIKLSYGDSPAMASPKAAARTSGLAEVADRRGIPLADFTRGQEVDLPEGLRLRKTLIAQGVLEADGLVNLCKLKTHALTGMTGAIKNLYGIIAGPRKAQLHVQYPDPLAFAKMLAELNHVIKPRLIVMDAVTAMEGNGPANGRPRQVGWILVGTDPVAIDTIGASIMGFNPHSLAMITAAHTAGLGQQNPGQIEVMIIDTVSKAIEPFRPADKILPGMVVADFDRPVITNSLMTRLTRLGGPFLRRFVLSRPVISANSCTRCGQCVQACPLDPKALDQSGPQTIPVYRYDRCIRCYCCQEICPAGAISVQKKGIL